MNTKTKIFISLGVLLIVLLFGILGYFLYSQQQQIKNLAAMVNGQPGKVEEVLTEETKKLIEETAKSIEAANKEQQRKQVLEETKSISGSVKSVSDDSLVVEVWYLDNGVVQVAESGAVAKEYTIKKDAKTEMDKDIKVGNIVNVFSDSPVLEVSSFTATKIERVSSGEIVSTFPVQPAQEKK